MAYRYPLSRLRQEPIKRRAQRGQAALDHTPYDAVVNAGVTMNKHVAKGDDAREVRNRRRRGWIYTTLRGFCPQ